MTLGPLAWSVVFTILTGAPSAGGPVGEAGADPSGPPPPRESRQLPRTPAVTASPAEGANDGKGKNLVSLPLTSSTRDAAAPLSMPVISRGVMDNLVTDAADGSTVTTREAASETHTTIALRWENDVIGGTDEGYSNGVSLMVSRDGQGPLGWVWKWIGARHRRWVSNYEVSHLIFTPRDLSRVVPDPADVPYSGILLGSVATVMAADDRLYGLKVTGGVRGPASFGEQVQKAVHRLTGSQPPQGWSHQSQNELVLNVTYEQRKRFAVLRSDSGWELQAIPLLAGSVGNAVVEGQLDGQIRVGRNLPDDFGVTETRGMGGLSFPRPHAPGSSPTRGVYAFLGGGGHAVSRNMVLDATSLTESPRLRKNPAFGSFQAGAVLWTRRFEAAFAYVVRGREYDSQLHPSRFGSASLAFRF